MRLALDEISRQIRRAFEGVKSDRVHSIPATYSRTRSSADRHASRSASSALQTDRYSPMSLGREWRIVLWVCIALNFSPASVSSFAWHSGPPVWRKGSASDFYPVVSEGCGFDPRHGLFSFVFLLPLSHQAQSLLPRVPVFVVVAARSCLGPALVAAGSDVTFTVTLGAAVTESKVRLVHRASERGSVFRNVFVRKGLAVARRQAPRYRANPRAEPTMLLMTRPCGGPHPALLDS